MALFNFFNKKAKQYDELINKNTAIIKYLEKINEQLNEQSERLHKIDLKQKETSLQIEEINDFIQNNSENDFIDALIDLVDSIGDFYYFSAADTESPLHEQAQMMWNTAIITVRSTGLDIIEAENEQFDFRFHSVECTEQDNDIPNGYIIKTLKCGYIYKDKIIRRASVVLNKIEKSHDLI